MIFTKLLIKLAAFLDGPLQFESIHSFLLMWFLSLCKTLILLSFFGGCNLAQISFRETLYTSFVLSNRSLKAL